MSEETAHALLSASSAHRWSRCAAALRMERDAPRTSSRYADEGTAAHELAAWALTNGKHPRAYPRKAITVNGNDWPVTAEMIGAVQAYCERVLSYVETGATLLVEQKVNYAHWLGVTEDLAFGTSDSVILHGDRIVVVDLKYGMGERVDAEDNEQLRLYALGAMYEYEMLGDFRNVTVAICQPRIGHFSEQSYTTDELREFALQMKAAAYRALDLYEADDEPSVEHFSPGDKQCRWCSRRATCPALAAEVEEETRDLFAALVEHGGEAMAAAVPEDRLAQAMSKVDLIESFCKAVRAEVERRLLAGQSVPGFKLVEGRKGARAWSDDAKAEKMLKSFRLRQQDMYDFKLKSPTAMEKALKHQSPTRWKKLSALIVQKDGKPSVAPDTDKREAILVSTVSDSFAALAAPTEAQGVEDLV